MSRDDLLFIALELIYMDTDFLESTAENIGAAASANVIYADCREMAAILPPSSDAKQSLPSKVNVGDAQNPAVITSSTLMYSHAHKALTALNSDGTNGSPDGRHPPLTRTVSSGHHSQQLPEYDYVTAPVVPPRKARPISVRLPAAAGPEPSDTASKVLSSKEASAPLPSFKPVVPQRNFVINSSKPHSAAAALPPPESSTTTKPTSSDFDAEATYQRPPPPLPTRPPFKCRK
jgi:hypothetical protein